MKNIHVTIIVECVATDLANLTTIIPLFVLNVNKCVEIRYAIVYIDKIMFVEPLKDVKNVFDTK